ncbi:4'-phosphopantetheinyl transferase family protein [Rothia nasisuis]|uniref:4'-phosphopantetheinyl transferase family protein n=1 Tax=Rothia nasisuis TaxID=2109647 RepID=UPI001F015881|nr:4'-phosphopantetheinyl transferase superfamily protein [Rothia nasisuis]
MATTSPPQFNSISQRATTASRTVPLRTLTRFTLRGSHKDLPVFIAPNTPKNRNSLFLAHPPDSSLAAAELERARTIPHSEHRNHWLFSRVLLKTFLAQILERTITEVRLHHSPLGKPQLAHLSFSLSHCQQYTALVFGGPEWSLGVDIEQVCSPATAQSIQPFLHPDEQRQLVLAGTEGAPHNVTQLWSRKEAFLKALGTGLLREPSRDFLGTIATPALPDALTGGILEDLTHPHITHHRVALCALPASTLRNFHLEFKDKDL